MNRPTRHEWETGSTHRSVDGDFYDKVWDYADQLKDKNAALKRLATNVLIEWNNWGLRGDFPNPLTNSLQALADALLKEPE